MKKKEEKKFVSYENMSDELMNEQLFELSQSSFWQAILKYNRLRDSELIGTLIATDPFTAPTIMARAQGTRIGLYFLEEKARQLEAKRKNEEKEKDKTSYQGY